MNMQRAVAVLTLLLAAAVGEVAGAPAVVVPGLPGPLEWKNAPVSAESTGGTLTIVSGAKTDWYISPIDGQVSNSAPLLLFRPEGDFVLSAKVTVDFRSQWDAGYLMVYADDTTWAKFALEMSAYKEPTVVTVVTRGISDDCNSTVVSGNSIYLRVALRGQAILLYTSPDGGAWRLVRAFSIGAPADLRVGFASQSPVGEGGSAVFSAIDYRRKTISDVFAAE
jgi:regulation of enolase protein 1 (concanavalin A-like superfamily)